MKDKIAFITGAATGIGRATALALGKEKAKIYVTDINSDPGKETVDMIIKDGGNAEFMSLNVGEKSQIDKVVKAIFEKEGRIDFAVNNAGIGGAVGPMHLVQKEDWDRMMQINLSSVFYCLQAEIGIMLQSGGGRIVNVASLAGVNAVPGGSPYAAAKHGVIGLTKTAAVEYANLNIRVNSVCPGFIQTAIIDDVPDHIIDFNINYGVPMKRIGQPNEVANAISWLLSDAASYINGHSLFIDGGYEAT